jgi:hypothetical protein
MLPAALAVILCIFEHMHVCRSEKDYRMRRRNACTIGCSRNTSMTLLASAREVQTARVHEMIDKEIYSEHYSSLPESAWTTQ